MSEDSGRPGAPAACGRGSGLAAGPPPPAPLAAPDARGRASGRGCECLILHIARSGITAQLAALLGEAVGAGPARSALVGIHPRRTAAADMQYPAARAWRTDKQLHGHGLLDFRVAHSLLYTLCTLLLPPGTAWAPSLLRPETISPSAPCAPGPGQGGRGRDG